MEANKTNLLTIYAKHFPKETRLKEAIRSADVIVWDESPVDQNDALFVIHGSFCNLMCSIQNTPKSLHKVSFGCTIMVVLQGGAFRQVAYFQSFRGHTFNKSCQNA